MRTRYGREIDLLAPPGSAAIGFASVPFAATLSLRERPSNHFVGQSRVSHPFYAAACLALKEALSYHPFPYTGTAAPLMAREASEARKRITSAMANGSTHFVKSALGCAARFCGVSMVAGIMQFTLMFAAFNSSASASVRRSTALFEAL